MQNKNVLVISGPTGAGESTVTNSLVDRYDSFTRLVTATSRPPRGTESHGVDYYFFSKEDFEAEIAAGRIAEYAYIENRDTYYGSYIPDLTEKIAAGKIVIANVQHVGLNYYKEHYGASSIFITVEDLSVIRARLKGRNPDISQEELGKRLLNAQEEIDTEMEFYDHVVINRDGALDETLSHVERILLAEGYVFS